MSDNKVIATVFFRVFGVADIIYAVLYWLYGTFLNLFEAETRFITTALWASTYLILGVFLIALSNWLGGLVVRGLDQPMPPPPPAAFVG